MSLHLLPPHFRRRCRKGLLRSLLYPHLQNVRGLIPLPPLDGSHVLMQLLPRDMAYKLAGLERYSFLILIVLLMTPVLSMILIPCRALIWHIFSLLLSPFF